MFSLGFLVCIASLSLGLVEAQFNQTCYFVNGDTSPPTQQQCFSGSQISGCCRLGGANPDTCLDSGLCLSSGGTVYQGGYVQTEKDWRMDVLTFVLTVRCFCPFPKPYRLIEGLAFSGWSAANHTQYWNVLICAPNKYCCRKAGDDTTDCCNDPSLVTTRGNPIGQPIGNNAVVTGASNSTQPECPAVTSGSADSTASCKSDNGKVAAVGAGVGASLGVLLLAALAAIVVLWRRQKALRQELNYTRSGGDAGVGYAQVREYDGATAYQSSTLGSPAPAKTYPMEPAGNVSEIGSPGNGFAEMEAPR